ncbi:MAG: hypothetical protein WBA20_00885 [Ketobacter sp.]
MNIDRVLETIFSYSFPSDEKLIEYALGRHGYGGDNGSYGITYPEDLDDFDRANGENIPDGKLEIYCKELDVDVLTIEERHYLQALKSYLANKGKIVDF